LQIAIVKEIEKQRKTERDDTTPVTDTQV